MIFNFKHAFVLKHFIIFTFFSKVLSLDCVQCDRQGIWYSPEENERHILNCQKGKIKPTKCTNDSHTHCIYNYYKQNGVMTITERRCGTIDDLSGCTIYKSTRRMARRHLIGGSHTDTPMTHVSFFGTSNSRNNHKRRDANSLFVEVCTGGCQEAGCLNAGTRNSLNKLLHVVLKFVYTLNFTTQILASLSAGCLLNFSNQVVCL